MIHLGQGMSSITPVWLEVKQQTKCVYTWWLIDASSRSLIVYCVDYFCALTKAWKNFLQCLPIESVLILYRWTYRFLFIFPMPDQIMMWVLWLFFDSILIILFLVEKLLDCWIENSTIISANHLAMITIWLMISLDEFFERYLWNDFRAEEMKSFITCDVKCEPYHFPSSPLEQRMCRITNMRHDSIAWRYWTIIARSHDLSAAAWASIEKTGGKCSNFSFGLIQNWTS